MMVKLTLIQGDCLKILPKIPDESVDFILTDFPYPNFDLFSNEKTDEFYKKIFDELRRVLKNNSFFATFWSIEDMQTLFKYTAKDFKFVWMIINYIKNAERNRIRIGFNHFNVIFLFEKGKATRKRQIRDVIEDMISSIKRNSILHPTPKFLKVCKKVIEMATNEGDIVLDPFLGSGTTMKACLELKRNCIGIEINPEFCEIVKKRLNWGYNLGNVEFEFYTEKDFDVVRNDRNRGNKEIV